MWAWLKGWRAELKVAKALREAPACPKHGRKFLAVCLECKGSQRGQTSVFCAKCGVPEEIIGKSSSK